MFPDVFLLSLFQSVLTSPSELIKYLKSVISSQDI